MSTHALIPFRSFNYPGLLEPVRDAVIKTLGHQTEEGRKIRACRYKSRCHSIYCPLCCRQAGYERKNRILGAACLLSRARLKFGTFTTKDVPLDTLRDVGQQIMRTGRRVLTKLKVTGYAARLETSFEQWGEHYHPHLHALIDSPPGGRGFVSAHAWLNEWLGNLPNDLHPADGGAHVAPVRELRASCTYLTKSPFSDYVGNAERIIDGITTCKGMRQAMSRGSLHSVQTTLTHHQPKGLAA
jgi:hypothetical protein